jgi:SAM-dependent methyltransferase
MDGVFDVKAFYDDLAVDYHLMFEDWKASVHRQGATLDQFIRKTFDPVPVTVLDCACGIGTQAIGLALHGYKVHATDLSPSAIERAKVEARNFGVSFTTGVADFKSLSKQVAGEFDLVICCDNSLSHMVSDEDLNSALKGIHSKVRAGGGFLASTRDYDALLEIRPQATMPAVSEKGDERRVSFQIWKWAEDLKTYDLELFMFYEKRGKWDVKSRKGMYRALKREELDSSLGLAGFKGGRWHFPDSTGYYQPIVTATRA